MAISPYEIENRVLAELLPDERARRDAHLRRIPIPIGTVLYESGVVPSHIYFPTTAIISLHCGLENGVSPAVAVVGNEGVVGFAPFTGGESTPSRAIGHRAGYAYRLARERLKEECNRHGRMLQVLLRYTLVVPSYRLLTNSTRSLIWPGARLSPMQLS